MTTRLGPRLAPFATAAVLLVVASWASADPFVHVTASDIGGGMFQYDLVLDNTTGSEPLQGLDILHAFSVFGLDESSLVGAPTGWDFFLPLPPELDDLDYFSLDPSTDVPVG